ncbi:MAG: hypothetical protein ACLVLH_23445 [Eisenbergiella massiliensis]
MVGFIACWAVVDPIFDALVAPLLSVLPDGKKHFCWKRAICLHFS